MLFSNFEFTHSENIAHNIPDHLKQIVLLEDFFPCLSAPKIILLSQFPKDFSNERFEDE